MTPEEIKEHFEANCLDGDSEDKHMLSSWYVLEYIQQYYILKPKSD